MGNGHCILLWLDNSIDHDPIAQRFLLLQFPDRDRVADLIQGNSWTIPATFQEEVQNFLLQQTNLIALPDPFTPDTLSWKGSASGVLTPKLAWESLRSREAAVEWYGLVWNKFIYPRLSCFS